MLRESALNIFVNHMVTFGVAPLIAKRDEAQARYEEATALYNVEMQESSQEAVVRDQIWWNSSNFLEECLEHLGSLNDDLSALTRALPDLAAPRQ